MFSPSILIPKPILILPTSLHHCHYLKLTPILGPLCLLFSQPSRLSADFLHMAGPFLSLTLHLPGPCLRKTLPNHFLMQPLSFSGFSGFLLPSEMYSFLVCFLSFLLPQYKLYGCKDSLNLCYCSFSPIWLSACLVPIWHSTHIF